MTRVEHAALRKLYAAVRAMNEACPHASLAAQKATVSANAPRWEDVVRKLEDTAQVLSLFGSDIHGAILDDEAGALEETGS